MDNQEKWDRRFLELARLIASWSKDPSTQTGAVIVDPQRRIVSTGFNGFPRGVDDAAVRYADRPLKYQLIVHCETNAVLHATRSLEGCTLYTWPFMSCVRCATNVIQAGITRCVANEMPPDKAERWADECALATQLFSEAGVELVLLPELTS